MRKPTFEATYDEGYPRLQLSIHNPQGVKGEFGGFEVLMKSGGVMSQNAWRSVANLTAKERSYTMSGTEALTMHTVTVRGRVSPNKLSELADSVEFMGLDRGVSLIFTTSSLLTCTHWVFALPSIMRRDISTSVLTYMRQVCLFSAVQISVLPKMCD